MQIAALPLGPELCLAEDEILGLATGGAAAELLLRAQRHCDDCDDCRRLLAEIARLGFQSGTVAAGQQIRAFQDGATLAERYRVLRWLGRGGMGEVYEVQDLLLGERVALKSLALETFFDRAALARIRLETSLARKVTHPNVCRVFDLVFHTDDDERGGPGVSGRQGRTVPLLTMELLDGCTLSAKIRETKALPLAEALRYAGQLASGLDAAHAAGVVHRDFKSDNVMLVSQPDGPKAVITDFGLACAVSAVSHSSGHSAIQPAGTSGYIAPERLAGQPATVASDVFSFGVVLHEMITGRLPHGRDSGRGSGLPAGWLAIIQGCLANDPSARFQSAGAAMIELQRRVTRHRRRRGALAAVPLLLASAGCAWLLPRGAPPADHRPLPRQAIEVQPLPVRSDRPAPARTAMPEAPSPGSPAARDRRGARTQRAISRSRVSRRPEPRLPQDDPIDPFADP